MCFVKGNCFACMCTFVQFIPSPMARRITRLVCRSLACIYINSNTSNKSKPCRNVGLGYQCKHCIDFVQSTPPPLHCIDLISKFPKEVFLQIKLDRNSCNLYSQYANKIRSISGIKSAQEFGRFLINSHMH